MTKGRERGLPPGWYRDPVHLHAARFWDGTNWTPKVVDVWQGEEEPPSSLDVWMGAASPTSAPPPDVVLDLRQSAVEPEEARANAPGGRANGRAGITLLPTGTAKPSGTSLPSKGRTLDVGRPQRAPQPGRPDSEATSAHRSVHWREAMRPTVARFGKVIRVAVAAVLIVGDIVLYRKVR